jgi:uncharacterized iron-regulated membrane protein
MRGLVVAVIVIVSAALSGCAQKGANINSFTDPTFAPGGIRSLAIFPIINASVAPAEGQSINQTIGPRILAKNPGLVIVSPSEAINRLNAAGQATVWAEFLDAYTSSGIPNSAALRQVGTTVGSDSILQGSVSTAVQQDGIYGVRFGGALVTVQFSLFDSRSGKLLWQASSEGRSMTATTVEAAPPMAEAVTLAVEKLIGAMPRL